MKIFTSQMSIKTRIMSEHHDTPISGHVGTAKTTELITRTFYWPQMYEEIKKYVVSCLLANPISQVNRYQWDCYNHYQFQIESGKQ